MILAAIDIGSNAVRLLIMECQKVEDRVDFTKLNFLRVPVRLGMDVFKDGFISEEKAVFLQDTMKIFQLLMNIYKVGHFRACATSAMREAANGAEIVRTIKRNTGIDIRIIDGAEEAGIIYETHIAKYMNQGQPYLYIDVGGGSTELSLIQNDQIVIKKSFDIGTIRLLNNLVSNKQFNQLKKFTERYTKNLKGLKAIGTGGNINKIRSMSKIKDKFPLTIELLDEFLKELDKYTIEERMHFYNMRRDRADVIVHALQIYILIMNWAGIEKIFVPKVGLADGLIGILFEENSK